MSAPDKPKATAPSSRLLYLGVGAAATLVIFGACAFYFATLRVHRDTSDVVAVSVTSKACEPNAMSVLAGDRTFEITNKSDRPVEWEIVDGVMVVAERENIAPAIKETLKVRLAPGTYEVTCGLLSNPRGILVVAPSREADAQPARATTRSFLGPLSEYKFYLDRQSGSALRAAQDLAAAIKAGDLDKSRALYRDGRVSYDRIEPILYRFSDLQNKIDPAPSYFEKGQDDPAFVGYGRIARGLFERRSLEGLSPIADGLVDDLTALNTRLKAMNMTSDVLAGSAARFSSLLSRDGLPEENADDHERRLAELDANLDGLGKLVVLLDPVLNTVNQELARKVDVALSDVRAILAKQKASAGQPTSSGGASADRAQLARAFAVLAESLNAVPSAIGIDANGT